MRAGSFRVPPELLKGKGVTDDSPGETYWKVANGIRLTGMPGYSQSLSTTEMWQISLMLANADSYEVGDVLRYSRASKETGIGKGAYARVKSIDAPRNRLTVELQDGTQRTYDPRRQQGVSVFREEMRSFSVGDRIQFTAPANNLRIANRELGSIESIDGDARLHLKMDSGHTVELDPPKHPHLDHGYAMTSHSSQGQTADRVLIHVDTELGAKDLLNSRMAYVSVSRGRHDAQIYTNNGSTLGQELSRDVSHSPRFWARARGAQDRTTKHAHESDQSGFRSRSVNAAFPNDMPRIARA